MASHSTAPWTNHPKLTASENHSGFRICNSTGDTLATVTPVDQNGEEGGANASLMTAAPELLAAAEQFIAAHKDGNAADLLDYFEDIFSEAVKKATGA